MAMIGKEPPHGPLTDDDLAHMRDRDLRIGRIGVNAGEYQEAVKLAISDRSELLLEVTRLREWIAAQGPTMTVTHQEETLRHTLDKAEKAIAACGWSLSATASEREQKIYTALYNVSLTLYAVVDYVTRHVASGGNADNG